MGSVNLGRKIGGNASQDRSIQGLVKVGLASRAVVYTILAYLAADIALHGSSPSKADSQGALVLVESQPAGSLLLTILAIGFAAYTLWRLALAWKGHEASSWKRAGSVAAALVYGGLCYQALSIVLGSGSSGGPSSHPAPLVAAALNLPAGKVLVGVAALAIAAGGIALAVWGWVHHDTDVLQTGKMTAAERRMPRFSGTGGEVTRGLLVLLVALYLASAAATGNASRVKSLGGALLGLSHEPFGPWLLALIAFGLLLFAISSCFEVVYRKA